MSTEIEGNHWIESWILRVGRWACQLAGGLAIVALVVGVLALSAAGTYWLGAAPSRPAPIPPPPEQPAVSLDDAKKLVTAERRFEESGPGTFPEVSDDLMSRAASLKALFPDANYSWEDVSEDYCRTPTSYGCLERGKRVTRRGVGHFVAYILSLVDADVRPESVKELERLLKDAKPEERASLVIPILVAEQNRRDAVKKAAEEHDAQVEKANLAYESAAASHRETAAMIAMVGAGGVGYGIATMVSICLVVAILAIERHLRAARTAPSAPERAEPRLVEPVVEVR